jgi:hypothetical protein
MQPDRYVETLANRMSKYLGYTYMHLLPSSTHVPAHKSTWTDAELVEEVSQVIRKELQQLLEKHIIEHLVHVPAAARS